MKLRRQMNILICIRNLQNGKSRTIRQDAKLVKKENAPKLLDLINQDGIILIQGLLVLTMVQKWTLVGRSFCNIKIWPFIPMINDCCICMSLNMNIKYLPVIPTPACLNPRPILSSNDRRTPRSLSLFSALLNSWTMTKALSTPSPTIKHMIKVCIGP